MNRIRNHQNLQNLEVPIHEIETLWLPFGILAYRLRSGRLLLLALCSMPVAILVSFGFMTLGDEGGHSLAMTPSNMEIMKGKPGIMT